MPDTIPIKCRCGHTSARATPALTSSVPGYPDSLPYYIHTCLACGAEYPCLSAAKAALRGVLGCRAVPAQLPVSLLLGESEPMDMSGATIQYIPGPFTVPQTPPAGEG